jgi:hypothetical protein
MACRALRRPARHLRTSIVVIFLGLASVLAAGDPTTSLEIPGGQGGIGFDDLRFAPSLNVLLVPAGRTGALDLVDPATRAVAVIGGFNKSDKFGGGHGEGTTSADEGTGLLFATDRDSRTIAVVDPRAKRIVSSAKLSSGPDYVRFVAPTREVWVTEPDAERIEIFRLEGESPVRPVAAGVIAVKGGPESLVIDQERGRAYTNLWGASTLEIDVKARAVIATWGNGCKGSRGIALDPARGFLFVGCAEGKAVVLDLNGGRGLSSGSSGDGVDIIDYSPKLGHLYLPGGRSATMATFRVSPKGGLTLLGTVATAQGAHCVAADSSSNAYVCDPKKGRLLVFHDPYP